MNCCKHIAVTLFAVLAVACSREDRLDKDYENISFVVDAGGLDVSGSQSKAIALGDGSNLNSEFNVVLYCTKDGSPITAGDGKNMSPVASGYWYPSGSETWAQWGAGQYLFYASAYPKTINSPASLTRASATQITVNQPTSYSGNNFVDYLLSYRFSADGNMQPLVRLELSHAMAMVDIYVFKNKSLGDGGVKVSSMELSNFFISATGMCNNHLQYVEGIGDPNGWNFSPSGDTNHSYSIASAFNPSTGIGGLDAADSDAGDRYESAAHIRAIVIPQTVQATFTPVYYVNESIDGTPHYTIHNEESFNLAAAGLPQRWESGHRYIYTATVDTGIHLQGQVADWVRVDFIEGTVLPGID